MSTRLIAAAALLLAVTACGPDLRKFNGPPIGLVFDGLTVCVPRRHMSTDDVRSFSNLTAADGTTRLATPRRMELTLFFPGLNGYTDELYAQYVRDGYDRRKGPTTWIRMNLLDAELATWHRSVDSSTDGFDPTPYVDPVGLKSWKRSANCVGRTAGFGAGFLVTLGAECAAEEVKAKTILGQEVRLTCAPSPGPDRCYLRGFVEGSGVHYQYDFHISHLAHWSEIHESLLSKTKQWTIDQSCIVGKGA
jgi:hypothetical protein